MPLVEPRVRFSRPIRRSGGMSSLAGNARDPHADPLASSMVVGPVGAATVDDRAGMTALALGLDAWKMLGLDSRGGAVDG
jgi:hypothetical protein